ncbi:MAG: hypothetical protein ACRCU6_02860, partial [Fusobacteriaceae bacterium]
MAGFGVEAGASSRTEKSSGTGRETSKLNITQEGLNKIMQDVLGQADGLAQLVQGQNSAGLFGSSTNTLLAQQFTTNLAGELAKLTGETVTFKEQQTNSKANEKSAKGKAGTV